MILELEVTQLRVIIGVLGAIIIFLTICFISACVRLKEVKNSLSLETSSKEHQRKLFNQDIARLNNRLEWFYNRDKDKKYICIKYELGKEVYVYRNDKINKGVLEEITYKNGRTFYTTNNNKNIPFDDIFDKLDELCEQKNINKDDILMYAYNNDMDKKERRIEC
jgi:hypothetical protein